MDAQPPASTRPNPKSPVSRRPARLREADAVGSLSKAFGIWMRNFVPVSVIVLVVNLPVFLYLTMLHNGGISFSHPKTGQYVMILLMKLLESVATGAVTYGVIQTLRGRPVGTGPSVAMGLQRMLPVLGTGILVGLAIVIGLVLLVIPGIIVSCGLAVAIPAAVVERCGGSSAMSRSWALTRGAKGSIFLALLLFGILGNVIGLLLGAVIGHETLPATLATIALQLLFSCGLSSVFGAVLYHDLRVSKEGANVEDIAHVFD